MESWKSSRAGRRRERLWLLAFLVVEGALLWQSFAPWLLRQVGQGE